MSGFGKSKHLAKVIKGMHPKYHDKQLTKNAKKQVTTIAKRVVNKNVQLKWWDATVGTQAAPSVISTTWGLQSLCDIPQGNLDTNRNGDAVKVYRLRLRSNVAFNPALATPEFVRLRMIIFQLHGNDAIAAPVIGDILNVSGGGTVDMFSYPRHDNRDQYTILMDRVITVWNPNGGTCYRNSLFFTKDVSLRKAKKMIQYTNATQNGSQKIFMWLASDAAANGPQVVVETRLNFRSA